MDRQRPTESSKTVAFQEAHDHAFVVKNGDPILTSYDRKIRPLRNVAIFFFCDCLKSRFLVGMFLYKDCHLLRTTQ